MRLNVSLFQCSGAEFGRQVEAARHVEDKKECEKWSVQFPRIHIGSTLRIAVTAQPSLWTQIQRRQRVSPLPSSPPSRKLILDSISPSGLLYTCSTSIHPYTLAVLSRYAYFITLLANNTPDPHRIRIPHRVLYIHVYRRLRSVPGPRSLLHTTLFHIRFHFANSDRLLSLQGCERLRDRVMC
jgi:hypothetical protein